MALLRKENSIFEKGHNGYESREFYADFKNIIIPLKNFFRGETFG
jgi:hypothetical protein